MTFDLEKARASDEALPYPLDAKEIWISGKGQMHINPPNEPSIFFTLSDLCEFRNLFHGQAAEIERLRADNAGLSKAAISIQEERDLAQAEFRAYHKAWEEGAAWIKELEELNAALMKNESSLRTAAAKYRKRAQAAEAKIGTADECPDDLPPIGSPYHISDELRYCHSCGKSIDEVKGNLCKGDYFIGSIFLDPGQEASRFDPPIDASYYFSCCDCSRSWQITEERKAALKRLYGLLVIRYKYSYPDETETLRAMLEDVEG